MKKSRLAMKAFLNGTIVNVPAGESMVRLAMAGMTFFGSVSPPVAFRPSRYIITPCHAP